MKYQYNFAFLQQWLDANPQIQKGAVQQALGVKSNNGLNSWIRKEGPMSVISMLRFCNSFQVPLSAFFRDMDAGEDAAVVPGRPDVNDQLEPDGGYATDASERKQGERSLLDPLDVTVMPSVVPGAVKRRKETPAIEEAVTTDRDGQEASEPHTESNSNEPTIIIGNVSDANMKALIDLETKHSKQRNRLLDIIANQQKEIADLTRMIEEYKSRPYHVARIYEPEEDAGIGMVAEDRKH